MLERFFGKKPEPFTGAPSVRRLKTYSAQSGYVYQYCYAGHRAYRRGSETGTEYAFQVSPDRKTSTPVSVFLSEAAAASWEHSHGRLLSSAERYAIAKLSLFQAFDERAHPAQMQQDILVRAADVEGILASLDPD